MGFAGKRCEVHGCGAEWDGSRSVRVATVKCFGMEKLCTDHF